MVELASAGLATAETFAGRVDIEWEQAALVTTMGRLAFTAEWSANSMASEQVQDGSKGTGDPMGSPAPSP